MNVSMSHGGGLFVQLQDVVFVAEYLNGSSENEDPATYLTPSRKVVEVRGVMAFIAAHTTFPGNDVPHDVWQRELENQNHQCLLKTAGLKFRFLKAEPQSPTPYAVAALWVSLGLQFLYFS